MNYDTDVESEVELGLQARRYLYDAAPLPCQISGPHFVACLEVLQLGEEAEACTSHIFKFNVLCREGVLCFKIYLVLREMCKLLGNGSDLPTNKLGLYGFITRSY